MASTPSRPISPDASPPYKSFVSTRTSSSWNCDTATPSRHFVSGHSSYTTTTVSLDSSASSVWLYWSLESSKPACAVASVRANHYQASCQKGEPPFPRVARSSPPSRGSASPTPTQGHSWIPSPLPSAASSRCSTQRSPGPKGIAYPLRTAENGPRQLHGGAQARDLRP